MSTVHVAKGQVWDTHSFSRLNVDLVTKKWIHASGTPDPTDKRFNSIGTVAIKATAEQWAKLVASGDFVLVSETPLPKPLRMDAETATLAEANEAAKYRTVYWCKDGQPILRLENRNRFEYREDGTMVRRPWPETPEAEHVA